MGMVKRWFEEHIDDYSDEELIVIGIATADNVAELREIFNYDE